MKPYEIFGHLVNKTTKITTICLSPILIFAKNYEDAKMRAEEIAKREGDDYHDYEIEEIKEVKD